MVITDSAKKDDNIITAFASDDVVLYTNKKNTSTFFVGVAKNTFFENILIENNSFVNLLLTAFNNRTRERNYFKKYSELLENEITEEEFIKEINENEDEYVIPSGKDVDENSIINAMKLSKSMKNIDTIDDFNSLFSFSDKSVNKFINTNANARIC